MRQKKQQLTYEFSNQYDVDFLISLIEKVEKNELDLDTIGKYFRKTSLIRQLSYKLPNSLMRKFYDGFKIQTYQQHELVYEQGEVGDTLYICLKGQVESYTHKVSKTLDNEDQEIAGFIAETNRVEKKRDPKPNYEEDDIIQMISDQEVMERFKLKREEKLDRYVRQMMKERAKNIEEQKRKEQEKIQFEISRIENRQKIIQQIIDSNKKANNAQNIGRTASKQPGNKMQSNLMSPSLKNKKANINLPKIDLQNRNSQSPGKSPLAHATSTPVAANIVEDNNLLLKRYKWKQSTTTSSRDQSIKKSESKAESSLFNETVNSFSESKFGGGGGSLKGSLIFNRLTKLKSSHRIKEQENFMRMNSSEQSEGKIIEESDGGDYDNVHENNSSHESIGQIDYTNHNFKISNLEGKSLIMKESLHNQSFMSEDDMNQLYSNLNQVCTYTNGEMFGYESFERNNERQSYIFVVSPEAKIATFEKSVFEDILMIYYEEKLNSEINFLKNNGLFHKFDDQELEQILLKLESVSIKKDAIIYKEDDASDRIYLVKEGEVEIDQVVQTEKKFEDYPFINQQFHQRRQKIAIIGPGQLFGESEILKDIKRVTRAKTLSTTNVFYVFDSNQIKFLLENSDLKENLNQARQNKSSWRNQRLKKIQIATKNHENALKKMLENQSSQISSEALSPRKENNQNSQRELPNQIKSVPSTIQIKSQTEKKALALHTHDDQMISDPYSFQSPSLSVQQKYLQHNNQPNNVVNQFYSFIPSASPSATATGTSMVSPTLSPLSKVPLKFERKVSLDFYSNYSIRNESDRTPKMDQSQKSLSVTSDRTTQNISFMQYNKYNQSYQNKLDSYNPEINESYQTLNPKPLITQIPHEHTNHSSASTQLNSNLQSPYSISTPTQNIIQISKRHKMTTNPLIYYGQKQLKSISSAELDYNDQSQEYFNENSVNNGSAIDTLVPIIKKSKILDSLSKAFKKQEQNKTNSPLRGDKRQLKTLFIYENEPLQQLYMNCKYNHKKYNISSRRSKRSSSISSSYSKNSRGRESIEFEKQSQEQDKSIRSIENRKRLRFREEPQKVEQHQNQEQSNSMDQRQYSDNKLLKEFVQKNTIIKVGFMKEEPNLKINTNIKQKIMQESSSKYRLKAMKSILESSHEIQNLNFLYKYSQYMKYNETVLPQTQNNNENSQNNNTTDKK